MKKSKKINCAICGGVYSSLNFRFHLKSEHGLDSKKYYDTFLKKESEGFCKYSQCKNKTRFHSIIKGYAIGCCNKHAQGTLEIKSRVKEGFLKKYGVSSFNNREKSKKTCLRKYGTDNVSKNATTKERKEKTNLLRRGIKSPLQSPSILEKVKKTNTEKYGTPWNINSTICREKTRKTFLKKYGTDNVINSEFFRSLMEKRGLWLRRSEMSKFHLYKRNVINETKKWTEELYKKWGGKCFYTGDTLITDERWKKENPNRSPSHNLLQPTIDHRVSIRYGFLNNIDPKTIGGLNNLCICSRSVNSRKRMKQNFKIGLDFHGVIEDNPIFFSVFTQILTKNGHEIHVITGEQDTPEFRTKLSTMGIIYTCIFSISSYHISIGTPVWYKDSNNPFIDEKLWDKTKADYCRREGIHFHIDDSKKYLQYFTTPYMLYQGNKS